MKRLINFDNRDVIAVGREFSTSNDKNDKGELLYKKAVDSVIMYQNIYDNDGNITEIQRLNFSKNDIVRIYNAVMAIEAEPNFWQKPIDELDLPF